MRFHVRLTVKAQRDVDAVLASFADRRESSAGKRWFRRLLKIIRSLEDHPERCAIAVESADLGEKIREAHVGRKPNVYRILFVIRERNVEVVQFRHSARDVLTADDL